MQSLFSGVLRLSASLEDVRKITSLDLTGSFFYDLAKQCCIWIRTWGKPAVTDILIPRRWHGVFKREDSFISSYALSIQVFKMFLQLFLRIFQMFKLCILVQLGYIAALWVLIQGFVWGHGNIFSDCHAPSYPVWMDSMLLIHSEQVEDDIKVLAKSSHSNFRIKLGGKKASVSIKLLINKTRKMMWFSFILKRIFLFVCLFWLIVDSFIP